MFDLGIAPRSDMNSSNREKPSYNPVPTADDDEAGVSEVVLCSRCHSNISTKRDSPSSRIVRYFLFALFGVFELLLLGYAAKGIRAGLVEDPVITTQANSEHDCKLLNMFDPRSRDFALK